MAMMHNLAPTKWLPTYAQSRQLLSPPYAVEAASSACAHYVDRSDNRLNTRRLSEILVSTLLSSDTEMADWIR